MNIRIQVLRGSSVKTAFRASFLLSMFCCIAFLSAPVAVEAAPRIGLGGNAGTGVSVSGVPGLLDPTTQVGYLLPAPEIQIFANKIFSIDFQWPVWNMVINGVLYGPNYLMNTFFHFHIPVNKILRVGVAPGSINGGGLIDDEPFTTFGYVMRIGPEFVTPDRHFAVGIYARPSFALASLPTLGMVAVNFEMLTEVTWTFYPKCL